MGLNTSSRASHCEAELPQKCCVEGAWELDRGMLRNETWLWWQLMSWTLILIASRNRTVADLWHALQEAEVEASLTDIMATIQFLKSSNGDKGNSLGPTQSAHLKFEGSPYKVLLDTGSPVTIVSMTFLLQALAKQKPKEQDPISEKQWSSHA